MEQAIEINAELLAVLEDFVANWGPSTDYSDEELKRTLARAEDAILAARMVVGDNQLRNLVVKWRKFSQSCEDCAGYNGDNHGDTYKSAEYDIFRACADELESTLGEE